MSDLQDDEASSDDTCTHILRLVSVLGYKIFKRLLKISCGFWSHLRVLCWAVPK